jgi:hypothetical protein
MSWKMPFDRAPSATLVHEQMTRLKMQLARFYTQDWFLKAVGHVPYMQKVSELAQLASRLDKAGNAGIGYYGQLRDLQVKLNRLSTMPTRGDAKAAGEAFGDVMIAASDFLGYAPPPFNAYAGPLKVLGENLGKIAYMMTPEHRMDISGYSKHDQKLIMSGAANGI